MKRNRWIGLMIVTFLCGCTSAGPASHTESPPQNAAVEAKNTDPNGFNEYRLTPLMQAAQADNPDRILELLRSGALLDLKDPEGRTAIDHALEHRQFSAFKCLLENSGAISSEKEMDLKSTEDPGLQPFKDILEEYPFYAIVATDPFAAHPDDFDHYFSRFPNGIYWEAMSNFFKKSGEYHLKAFSEPPDPDQLRQFISDIHQMGARRYIVKAATLHIRSSAGSRSPVVGSYRKNEVLYGESTSGEWIKTDKGWVSKRYLKQESVSIPYAKEILANANILLTPAIAADNEKSGGGDPLGPQKELEQILKAPDLQSLEDYILKYKDHSGLKPLVRKAKNAYKSLVLNQ